MSQSDDRQSDDMCHLDMRQYDAMIQSDNMRQSAIRQYDAMR